MVGSIQRKLLLIFGTTADNLVVNYMISVVARLPFIALATVALVTRAIRLWQACSLDFPTSLPNSPLLAFLFLPRFFALKNPLLALLVSLSDESRQ